MAVGRPFRGYRTCFRVASAKLTGVLPKWKTDRNAANSSGGCVEIREKERIRKLLRPGTDAHLSLGKTS